MEDQAQAFSWWQRRTLCEKVVRHIRGPGVICGRLLHFLDYWTREQARSMVIAEAERKQEANVPVKAPETAWANLAPPSGTHVDEA